MTPPSSSTARASGRTARPWLRSSARTRSGAAAGCRRTGPARATRARRRRRRRSSAAKGRPSAASTSSRTRSRSSTSALANSASRAARRCRSATSRARSRASSRPTGSSIGGVEDTPPIAWTPSPERIASATITRYREWLSETRGLALEDYADLWQWSVDELEHFWRSIWEFFEVDASEPYERVLTTREMPGAQWFPGARLSYAEHVFRRRADDEVAIRHASELRPLAEWTWGELRAGAGAVAGALREAGVVAGDRVAGYLPNIPETVAAFLGCASIGATWSSCAPEFGVRSVVDRFAQIEPKVLLTVDGYRYGGRDFDRSETIAALERELPTLRQTLVLPYLAGGHWELAPAELEFAQLPFDHPLWVLYSSGTTGLPKAIVHGQGGILLEHLKKLRLHLDAQAGDRLFWSSGGPAVCTGFVGGVPTLPVCRGGLQVRALGARVEAWSEDGRRLVGEVGELVITEPMPSMPLYLWGDEDGSRYRESYFSTFPGVWRHGDWIEITERGTAIITGRSDATINRGGVRMGTSELYRSVLALDWFAGLTARRG